MADESRYPTRIAPYGLRMPPDLKARIEASATANNRSLNAEIVSALEYLYPAPTQITELREMLRQAIYEISAAQSEDDVFRAMDKFRKIDAELEEAINDAAAKLMKEKEREKEQKPISDDDLPF